MAYLLDTNIFITSKNELPCDVWPSFWKQMAALMQGGKVLTSVKVKEEIERGKDELTQWMKNNAKAGFYCSIDSEILCKYAEVQNWAKSIGRFTSVALNNFANVADAYLVATAAAKGWKLVTYETSDINCKKRVKIPDACNALLVSCCDVNTMFRELGVRI